MNEPDLLTPEQRPTAQPEPAAARTQLTRLQKRLVGVVTAGAVTIAGIGFAGSYTAVTHLAAAKGFGTFSYAFPIGIDAGIVVLLALDLVLTWLRIPFPLLRQGAWGLTAATIAFNAATSWPDPTAVGMHAAIPTLFVIVVEAARHAIGRIADITADRFIESPPLIRWLLAPTSTARLYRRMRVWGLRSYEDALAHQQEIRIYRAQLRKDHGKKWRRIAPADKLLVLELARYGKSITEAIEMPKAEARKQAEVEARQQAETLAQAEAEAEAKHQAELRRAEAEAKRRSEIAEAEAAEAEARHRIEAAEAEAEAKLRIETARAEAAEAKRHVELAEAEAEAKLRISAKQTAEAETARLLKAETDGKLAQMAREQREAEQQEAARRRAEEQRVRDERERQSARERAVAAQQRIAQAETATRSASTSTSASASPRASVSVAASTPKRRTVSASTSASASDVVGGQRSKRQTEIDIVLALITEAGNPKAVSLEKVMEDFDLKQTTAWDRLSTAQQIWAEAQRQTA